VLLAAACGGGSTSSGPGQATGSPIKIGVLDDVSTTTPVEGPEMRVNTDLAIAQANASGGIHGHRLEAVYVNPNAQPDEAVTLAQQLVQQQGVDVLVGGVLSSECLAVENLVPRLQITYLSSTGCAAEAFTAQQCNAYSFRVSPEGRQVIIPLSTYIVSNYGKRWAIVYPNYAFGFSQVAAYQVGLTAAGGELTQKIAIPLGEPNLTPYITGIHTDGSIDGVINTEVGGDLPRVSAAIGQFGINTKMPVVGVFGKERYAGVYPPDLTGDIGQSPELSNAPRENQYDVAYHAAFRAQLAKEDANIVSALGGAAKAVPGDLGYEAYTTITALKEAMRASNFTGKQDTAKLLKALSTVNAKQGPDFPGGDFQMDPTDHQGVQTTYIAKINGQQEKVLATYPASKLPPIGSCKA
jgi:branched-chain amino acid transport system substrate-binding protein